MSEIICCFAGHRDIYCNNKLQKSVYNKCEELIIKDEVVCFWVGNYGGFDKLVAAVVRKLKQKHPHIKLELVLPYVTKEVNDEKELYYKAYDNIIIADISEHTPAKFKILKCNQYMVDHADFLIAYVNYSFGGASQTLAYAQRRNIKIFNLGTHT